MHCNSVRITLLAKNVLCLLFKFHSSNRVIYSFSIYVHLEPCSHFFSSLMYSLKNILFNPFSFKLFVQVSATLDFYFLYCVNFSKLAYKIIINFRCNLISCIVDTRLYDIKIPLANKFSPVDANCENLWKLGPTKSVFRWNY